MQEIRIFVILCDCQSKTTRLVHPVVICQGLGSGNTIFHLSCFEGTLRVHDDRRALGSTRVLPDEAGHRFPHLELRTFSFGCVNNLLGPASKDISSERDLVVLRHPIHQGFFCIRVAHIDMSVEGINVVEPLDVVKLVWVLFVHRVCDAFNSRECHHVIDCRLVRNSEITFCTIGNVPLRDNYDGTSVVCESFICGLRHAFAASTTHVLIYS